MIQVKGTSIFLKSVVYTQLLFLLGSTAVHAQTPQNASASISAQPGNEAGWQMKPVSLQTRWAKKVTPQNVLPEYPRPQMVRSQWQNLNGLWEYAITADDATKPSQFDGKILVPFPIESALSGVQKALLPKQRLWYKRAIVKPNVAGGKRVLLHFGAVDWEAKVYVNGKEMGVHTGGYQNFSFDITDALKDGKNTLEVSVFDPTDKGINPRGKQVLRPGNIMYTASSGIWQTVWMETVPAKHISNIRITPDIDNGQLQLEVLTASNTDGYTVEAIASNGKTVKGQPNEILYLPVPNAKLWSPDQPHLYNLTVKLINKGKVVDTIDSYFGMRKMEVKKDEKGIDRLFLNNKYTYHLGALDQGFWPEGLYTAPTDEALKFDIVAIKSMGFNTIRKHIKLEPARWYYHADKVGMLVWQDMVTCADGTPAARAQFEKENRENIEQLYNYPSIVSWVLFNEGWGRYDQQRLTDWMKAVDPSRIINGHSGENYDKGSPLDSSKKWINSDVTDMHHYPGPGTLAALPGKARVVGEWGGIRVFTLKHQWNDIDGWGYIQSTPADFKNMYDSLVQRLSGLEKAGLSGSIYTEPFDVETEENGMITYDREIIKIAPEELRKIHSRILQAPNSFAGSNLFKVNIADTANPDLQYASLFKEYKNGRHDEAFLRKLTLMAVRLKDLGNIHLLANFCVSNMSDPFKPENLQFIARFTNSIKDPGFAIVFKNQDKVSAVIGNDRVRGVIKSSVFNDEIKEFVSGEKPNPDWNALEKKIIPVYGSAGEEMLMYSKVIHYLNEGDLERFYPATNTLLEKYPAGVGGNMLNEFAWTYFLKVTDTNQLKTALQWSKLSVEEEQSGARMDTYANLLHKLGRQSEAIEWQQKAVDAEPWDEGLRNTLEKMKRGEKTWN